MNNVLIDANVLFVVAVKMGLRFLFVVTVVFIYIFALIAVAEVRAGNSLLETLAVFLLAV